QIARTIKTWSKILGITSLAALVVAIVGIAGALATIRSSAISSATEALKNDQHLREQVIKGTDDALKALLDLSKQLGAADSTSKANLEARADVQMRLKKLQDTLNQVEQHKNTKLVEAVKELQQSPKADEILTKMTEIENRNTRILWRQTTLHPPAGIGKVNRQASGTFSVSF